MLALLAAICAFNYMDFQTLGLVLQSIKSTFHVSDVDLGVLTGFAFTAFYSIFGVPIAMWADRGNRVAIIAISLGLRSVLVMLSGVAQTFGQLLLIRVGVAIGEAGCVPPALSLIADHFGPAERPKAVGVFWLGAPLSIVLGYLAGGWISQSHGWREMFVLLGAPGAALAVMARLTLVEPRTCGSGPAGGAAGVGPRDATAPSGRQVARALWGNRTFRHILWMLCVNYFFGYAAGQWQPAFYMRSFGLSTLQIGLWFSVVFGAGGLLGTYGGGYLATRYAPHDERVQLKAVALLNVGFGIASAFAYWSSSAYWSLALTGVAYMGSCAQGGPLFATLQTVVPERMVAIATALVMLSCNLVGGGLGPIAVGALSDALHHSLGAESLRFALLATCPGFLWGSWHAWRAAETVASDMVIASRGAAW